MAEYSWKNGTLVFGGRVITGVREIKFKTAHSKEFIQAAGDEALDITSGNKEHTGTITFLGSEVFAAEDQAKIETGKDTADLTDITWNATWALADKRRPEQIRTYGLENIEFEEYELGMAQNDSSMEVSLPFKCLRIRRGI